MGVMKNPTLAYASARWDELENVLKETGYDPSDDDEFITIEMQEYLDAIEEAKKLVKKLEKEAYEEAYEATKRQ